MFYFLFSSFKSCVVVLLTWSLNSFPASSMSVSSSSLSQASRFSSSLSSVNKSLNSVMFYASDNNIFNDCLFNSPLAFERSTVKICFKTSSNISNVDELAGKLQKNIISCFSFFLNNLVIFLENAFITWLKQM